MKKYTFLKMIEEVLQETKIPMSSQEIWNKAKEMGLEQKISSVGKTPWNTVGAKLYVDMKDNNNTIFQQVSSRPALFGLKKLKYDTESVINDELSDDNNELPYLEKDLHAVLVKYLYSNQHFKCYTKTINQSSVYAKSKAQKANMWVYSDLIGVYLPFEEFDKVSLELFRNLNITPYKVFSFEMKKKLNFSNYKEYYFQAVSNSSWANEGYLVCSEILDDPSFLDELRILNSAHGIGIILLNLENPEQSEIIFNSRQKDNLDMIMIDKLIKQNKDVNWVFSYINDSYKTSKKLETTKFDKVLTDEEYSKYAKEKFNIEV